MRQLVVVRRCSGISAGLAWTVTRPPCLASTAISVVFCRVAGVLIVAGPCYDLLQAASQAVSFYVGDASWETVARTAIPPGTQWVLNHPFLRPSEPGCGRQLPGPPDATTQFSQDMMIDYLRIFQTTFDRAPEIKSGGVDSPSHSAVPVPSMMSISEDDDRVAKIGASRP